MYCLVLLCFPPWTLLLHITRCPLAEQDIPKTASATKYGLYEFKKLPFWLPTAPQTYECLMELTLSGLQWCLCLIYLDDVIVFFYDFEEQMDRLDQVLTWVGHAGLKLKPSKCVFFAPKVSFLGHIVSKDGVSPDPDNITKIVNWPPPKNVHDMCEVSWVLATITIDL